MMKLNLENTGEFEVDAAYSGEEGVVKAKDLCYDLIVTDFSMPGMNGEDVIKQLKEIDERIPIMLFTIYHDDQSMVTEEIKAMADGLIEKPINHEALYKMIKAALEKGAKG